MEKIVFAEKLSVLMLWCDHHERLIEGFAATDIGLAPRTTYCDDLKDKNGFKIRVDSSRMHQLFLARVVPSDVMRKFFEDLESDLCRVEEFFNVSYLNLCLGVDNFFHRTKGWACFNFPIFTEEEFGFLNEKLRPLRSKEEGLAFDGASLFSALEETLKSL